ncbi:MAG: 5-formyltetrahydrofolate cyclo-ligase [bacterium]|nr:5-formyltetrahydrofolate cyclo-ligase [bacterium]
MAQENSTLKQDLRLQLLRIRDQMGKTELTTEALIRHERLGLLLKSLKQDGTILCGYAAIRNEISVDAVMNRWLKMGGRLALPRFVNARYELAEVMDLSADLVPGKHGIPEPVARCPVIKEDCVDVWVVPGVGFDAHKYRLGYGKGIYDTLLKNSKGYKIGVGYEFQRVQTVFPESHDIKMDDIFLVSA